tara:strand:+ start:3089 stop:3337 length:249 start_codon:yes stop_codon:yes gene_type:complete
MEASKGRKNDKIVENITVKEKITFRGKKIIRERIEKKWNIPKIIKNDIGFQMMFGFDPPNNPKPAKSNLEEKSLDYAKYKRH